MVNKKMVSFLKKLFKKKETTEFEIDDSLVKETARLAKTGTIKRCDFRSKNTGWIEGHLEQVNNVVNNNSLGAKNKNNFEIDGKRYFKDDNTRVLFSKMYENYTAYYYTLKEYLDLRKELLKYNDLGSERIYVSAQIKDAEEQMELIEKKLNVYLDNIIRIKERVRTYLGIA